MPARETRSPSVGGTSDPMHRSSLAERRRVRKLGVVSWVLGFCLLAAPPVAHASPDAVRLEAAVSKHLHLFLAVPERRESGEGITLDDHGDLEIRFLRSLPPTKQDAFVCQGIRWLLLGRLKKADGVAGLFRALPDVRSVTLVFYALETTLQADAAGGYEQRRRAVPRARFRVGREKGAALDPAAVDALLGPETCLSNGRNLLDLLWTPVSSPAP